MGDGFSGLPRIGDCRRGPTRRQHFGECNRRREVEHANHRLGAEAAACPYCGGGGLSRFGRTPRGEQRWHCRACGRKHQATTGTARAGIWQPHKFVALLADMLGPQPSSCRKLARALVLDKSTVWQWRQKASRGFAVTNRSTLIEPVQTSVAVVRESRKASREWVNHRRDPAAHAEPDRLRWLDYRRLGLVAPDHLPRYRIPVGVSIDGFGRRTAEVFDSVTTSNCSLPSAPSPATSAEPAVDQSVSTDSEGLVSLDRLAGGTTQLGNGQPSGVCETGHMLAEFGRFLRPFCGPATRHLPGYVAWYITRLEDARLPDKLQQAAW